MGSRGLVSALVTILLVATATDVSGKRHKHRQLEAGRKGGKTSLGSWEEAQGPMHKVQCGARACRPGEGNLKGYGESCSRRTSVLV